MSHRDLVRRAVVPSWATLLAFAICAPMFARGYVLSYDMVWVPHLDIGRSEIWGLGSALPRAVPSDAVVALLGAALPAMVVQKAVLTAALIFAGLGADQLVKHRPLPARLATVTLAVWNPFVAERLVLGQWPLLIAYAGIFWLIAALCSTDRTRWSTVALALAATALTPATGLMGAVVGVIAAWRRGSVRVLAVAIALNLPWVVAALLQRNPGQSDSTAVALFDVRSEGSFGRVGSALTLGGIWNSEVVPTSRTLGIAVFLAVAMGLVMIVGLAVLLRSERRLTVVLSIIGVLGLTVALAGWAVPDVVARIVEDVPGGGIVRDGTRWLALLAPLEVVAFGAGVCALVESRLESWRVPMALFIAALPMAALPDLAWGAAGRLTSTDYPAVWADARQVISESKASGDLLSLPFSAYRAPSWNGGRTVIDPAGRYFDRTTVTNDELEVSGRTIAGEDPRAARVGAALAGLSVLTDLADEGIGIVVVDTQAPGADAALRLVGGAHELDVVGADLRVFAVPGAESTSVNRKDRRAMTAAWGIAGVTLLMGLAAALRAAVSAARRARSDRSPVARDAAPT